MRGRPGVADHLDIGLGVEQIRHPTPDDLMVVEQEHPDRPVP
ncbi:hypothetical protein [Streptomyces tubercidicus]|nr:hypothetical protein OG761_35180 [Streptomyces tubercidicus]